MSCPPPLSTFILDPFPSCSPYPHLHVFGLGAKVKLIIMLYFNLLIVPQGLGLLSCRSIYFKLIFFPLVFYLIQVHK